MNDPEAHFDAPDDAAASAGEDVSPAEHLLDDIGVFEPAESLFEGEVTPAAATPPSGDEAQNVRVALDLLAQLQKAGGEDMVAAVEQIQAALAPIAGEMRSTADTPQVVTAAPTAATGELELEGVFDSVTDVLEGVFDGAAAIVEGSVEDAVVMSPRTEAPPPVAEPPPPVESMPEPEPEPEPAPEPTTEPTLDTDADEAQDVDRILSSLGVEPSVEIERLPGGEPVESAGFGSSPKDGDDGGLATVVRAKVEPPLLIVMNWISLPVQYVPAKLRPAVDWLALSLVFWVPVVWVIALLI